MKYIIAKLMKSDDRPNAIHVYKRIDCINTPKAGWNLNEKDAERESNIDNRQLQSSQFYINSFEYERRYMATHSKLLHLFMCCCSRTTIKQYNFYGQNMMSNKRPHIYTSATDVPTTVNTQSAHNHQPTRARSAQHSVFLYI